MSRKTILYVEFISCMTGAVLFGVWLSLSAWRWMKGDLTMLWAFLTLIFAALIVFDAYSILKRLSLRPSRARTGMLVRLIGIIFVGMVTGATFMQALGSWLQGDAIFWGQLVSTAGLLFLTIVVSRMMLTRMA